MTKSAFLISSLVLLLALVLPRVSDLSAFQTADEKRWVANTAGFITNLAHGDLAHLMQQPHPGITTQWLAAPTVFSASWTIRKLPLVISQSIMILVVGYILWRLFGQRTAAIAILLLSLDPVLIAHTRVYAMDSLLSLFLLLSISLLFLWSHTRSRRYLLLSSFTAAAAVLSKLSGILILPFSLLLIIYLDSTSSNPPHSLLKNWPLRSLLLWSLAFLIGLVIILPSLAINPSLVISDMVTWFRSDDYQLHQTSRTYYFGTLAFLSTPLQLIGLILCLLLLFKKRLPPRSRQFAFALIIFCLLFFLMMSFGAKKGDRYLLPVFLALDVITAQAIAWLSGQNFLRWPVKVMAFSVIVLLIMQTFNLALIHPHELAYVNSLTTHWLGERRLGWGEGLDLAAAYINRLPSASNLTVASYYPTEFQANFQGHAVPAHQHDAAGTDYIVIYRAMLQRGSDAWETDVVNYYRSQTPIKTIFVGSVPMAWIFKKEPRLDNNDLMDYK